MAPSPFSSEIISRDAGLRHKSSWRRRVVPLPCSISFGWASIQPRCHYVRRKESRPFALRLSDKNSFVDVNTHNRHTHWNGAMHDGGRREGVRIVTVERALLAAFVLPRWSPIWVKCHIWGRSGFGCRTFSETVGVSQKCQIRTYGPFNLARCGRFRAA